MTAANDIKGDIPTEIAKLTHLTVLDLFANALSGTYLLLLLLLLLLMARIGYLYSVLTFLYVYAIFSGTIPPILGELTELQILRLEENLLSG